jgi:hypothetical protein
MFPTALASCTLCIQYRLWSIARARNVFITPKEKKRQKITTWLLCLGLPMLVAVLHYVVQGHRYNVFEDLGPLPSTYNVTLAFPLFFMWDPLLCLISAVYAVLTIRLFLARRKEFDAVLASGSSNVNKDKYLRLLCLAAQSVVVHLPLSLWVICVNSTAYTVYPWISWEDTHSNYGRIAYFNRFLVSQSPDVAIQASVTWWSVALCGFNYFLFFGFGEEAMKNYKGFIGLLLKPFGIKYPTKKKRTTVKRSWFDILLGRPGKPTNLSSSAPTSSMPQFNSKPSTSRPSGNVDPNPTRTQTTTGGGNDLHLDLANLDFLDPAEARKQARISAYTRPGQATRAAKSPESAKGRSAVRSSFDSSIHRSSSDSNRIEEEGSDITDEKGEDFGGPRLPPRASTSKQERDIDLEAQEPWQSEIEQARRRAILEANPELTEEVTF